MKRILITGKNSYVGNSFENWIREYNKDQFKIDKVTLRNNEWKNMDLSIYDVVLHVAGIAHVSSKKSIKDKYYKINRDLTYEVALKAKNDGVNQFIFMSSIIVYGDSKENKVITKFTQPNPADFYGDSKLQAEKKIESLNSKHYKVSIVRPPMIYGPNSKGNFPKLINLSKLTFVFPSFYNERSMLYIDNLSEFIRLLIVNNDSGVFFPQNNDFISIKDLVNEIAINQNKKIIFVKFLNPIVYVLKRHFNIFSKLFGTMVYDKQISKYKKNYQLVSFKESIRSTLGKGSQ